MKLVAFQRMQALNSLINNGELICNEKYIDIKKSGSSYNWVVEKMNEVIEHLQNILFGVGLNAIIQFVLQNIRENQLKVLM